MTGDEHVHPEVGSQDWDNPDFCPFCGEQLPDGGAGFIDHTKESDTCRERFEVWRSNIADDVAGEWTG
ncbi:DUF7501 family protein [Halosimplex halobium]|uniref:DUF7501 family protein n=1 Tax=Halosimplex halobium TaxID=3396618 RepID=UPI003F57C0B0